MNKYSIFTIIKILITIRVDKQASHNLQNYYNTLKYKINLKILQNTFR
jgi:hypothetical protein